ncbi:nitrogenase component 1 [Roseburia hominis]
MGRLFEKMISFAADYSGAASVLYELGGLTIFCDAGACLGGYRFGEEPRGGWEKSRVFSASLRERNVVMGIDRQLTKDAVRTYEEVGGTFIALIGTPVPAVIGADLGGIAGEISKQVSKGTPIPAFGIATNGMEYYDAGQEKAYRALMENVVKERAETLADVNVIGATPIDMWDLNQIQDCILFLKKAGAENPAVWGSNGHLAEIAGAAGAKLNIAVSVSGIKIVKSCEQKYGTPYLIGYPVGEMQEKVWAERIRRILLGDRVYGNERKAAVLPGRQAHVEEACSTEGERPSGVRRALILGEQVSSCSLRDMLREEFGYGQVDICTFFKMEKDLMEEGDMHLREETDLPQMLSLRGTYHLIVADPLYGKLLPYQPEKIAWIPHMAVSSAMYLDKSPVLFGRKGSIYFRNILK